MSGLPKICMGKQENVLNHCMLTWAETSMNSPVFTSCCCWDITAPYTFTTSSTERLAGNCKLKVFGSCCRVVGSPPSKMMVALPSWHSPCSCSGYIDAVIITTYKLYTWCTHQNMDDIPSVTHQAGICLSQGVILLLLLHWKKTVPDLSWTIQRALVQQI